MKSEEQIDQIRRAELRQAELEVNGLVDPAVSEPIEDDGDGPDVTEFNVLDQYYIVLQGRERHPEAVFRMEDEAVAWLTVMHEALDLGSGEYRTRDGLGYELRPVYLVSYRPDVGNT